MFSFFGSSGRSKDPEPSSVLERAPTQTSTPAVSQLPALPAATRSETPSSIFSQRSLKQLGLFFAGAGFFTVSTIIARRSIARKTTAAYPKFYQPSHRPTTTSENNGQGSLMAVEALNLATLNVLSFFMMLTGGASFALDVSSVDDLRRLTRSQFGTPGAQTDEEAEQEIEEWAASVLKRKEDRDNSSRTQQRK